MLLAIASLTEIVTGILTAGRVANENGDQWRIEPQNIRPQPSVARQRADRRHGPANRALQVRVSAPSLFRREAQQPLRYATSLARIPLFLPWITIDVIAEVLPKTRSVVRHQSHTLHPFSALPQIKMRNEKPRGGRRVRAQDRRRQI